MALSNLGLRSFILVWNFNYAERVPSRRSIATIEFNSSAKSTVAWCVSVWWTDIARCIRLSRTELLSVFRIGNVADFVLFPTIVRGIAFYSGAFCKNNRRILRGTIQRILTRRFKALLLLHGLSPVSDRCMFPGMIYFTKKKLCSIRVLSRCEIKNVSEVPVP